MNNLAKNLQARRLQVRDSARVTFGLQAIAAVPANQPEKHVR
jgi:hypothetical protein